MNCHRAVYDLLYKSYFGSYQKATNTQGFWWKMFQASVWFSRKYLPNHFTKCLNEQTAYGLFTGEKREVPIIVSLTTFPARINKVWITIETLMMQTCKADKIILWLSKDQFPEQLDEMPEKLLEQMKRGLEIRFVDGDLRSHKKYFYAMQEYPDARIVTVDDDVFYALDTLEILISGADECPEEVIGMSCPKFNRDNLGTPIVWGMEYTFRKNCIDIGVCGCGGVLYPPKAFLCKAFDIAKIKQLCPLADDLWLTAMTYMNGRKITSIGRMPFPISIPDTQEQALTKTNNTAASEINNNTQWQAILDAYSDELAEWRRRFVEENI